MGYFFEQSEPLPAGIKRILDEQLDQASRLLQTTDSDRLSAVHEARKTIKRLRALLHLIRSPLGKDRFQLENGRLRAISHQLAPLRESTAMIELVDRLADEGQPEAIKSSLARLRDRLTANQQQMERRFIEEEPVLASAAAGLLEIRTDLQGLTLPPQDFDLIAGGLARVYRQGKRRMAAAYRGKNNPEQFHDWRKRVKHLWHHVELLTPLWPPLMTPLADELHRLSDFLGDGHDMAELATWLADAKSASAGPEEKAPLLLMLNARRKGNEGAANPLGSRIYAESPRAFVRRIKAYWKSWRGGDPIV